MSIFENINFSLRGAISITSAAAEESLDIRKTKQRRVDEQGRITTFVPGMNQILEKPGAEKIIRHQLFSALSPHTTRLEARSCGSCHRNDQALGIIDKHVTHPDHPEWILPRGWIDDGQDKPGESSNPRARSLNLSEIQKIRRVGNCLPCHHQEERFFQDFKSWRSDLPEDHPPL